jgi:hypothetical protein
MHARHGSRFVLGLLLGLVACTARAIPVEEIPTPRPAGWAVDLGFGGGSSSCGLREAGSGNLALKGRIPDRFNSAEFLTYPRNRARNSGVGSQQVSCFPNQR